jgi:hypothetical protein
MKKINVLILLFILSCSFIQSTKKKLLVEFTIGNFSYNMYIEEKYLHDDNLNAEYFVAYRKNLKNSLCSSFKTAIRNDTIFIKGNFLYTNEKLEFKEYYYHQNKQALDSLMKIFSPDKKGDLILRKVIEYKNGKATTVL